MDPRLSANTSSQRYSLLDESNGVSPLSPELFGSLQAADKIDSGIAQQGPFAASGNTSVISSKFTKALLPPSHKADARLKAVVPASAQEHNEKHTKEHLKDGLESVVDVAPECATTHDSQSSSSFNTNPFEPSPPLMAHHSQGIVREKRPEPTEVMRLKKELELAHEHLAQMNLELTQARRAQYTIEQAIGSPFPQAQELAFSSIGTPLLHPGPNAEKSDRFSPSDPFGMPRHGANNDASRIDDDTQPISSNSGLMTPLISGLGISLPGSRPQNTSSGFGSAFLPPLTFEGPYPLPNGLSTGSRRSASRVALACDYPTIKTPWGIQNQPNQHSYMSTAEPVNYRRLLDRNVNYNWRYIVDKIVCSNDQQASIFLQQKLKVASAEQKFDIVQCIIDQAYPLMVNRFGNFLVQRCFEHGTPEQVVAIAQAIRGNALNLSMDAFGCHVVQKAFDCVPEEYKAIMVHELLRRIPETVIHRYACHVWQKLFELRWSGSPPQIMQYVNEALGGMWHEVALGETGSLVVQNIFENCLEEDKRPCIDEVLGSIDVVAHGQFGNWCIQHICEHGSLADRTRATEHILRYATEYSTDQFASKVVEKCLKIGGTDFLDRYLDRVCEVRLDRPRMPLIDISGDQFGNYLIQYILSSADPGRREVVSGHIRRHMVSLRGSKYGSRVAMLCCSNSFSSRPGQTTDCVRNNGFGTEMPRSRGFGGPNSGYVGLGRHNYHGNSYN